MEVGVSEMFFSGGAPKLRLKKTDGEVIPYNGYRLPEILGEKPLVQSHDGRLQAYKSGNRSSIVFADGEWYKKKGDAPVWGEVHGDEPFGSMSRQRAMNELDVNRRIEERMSGYGTSGPLVPAAIVDYEDRSGMTCYNYAHSAVLKTLGETRLSSIDARLNAANREGILIDEAYRFALLGKIAEWMAFSHRVLKESSVYPSERSFSLGNYAVYKVSGGFGVGRVDLSAATASSDYNFDRMAKSMMHEMIGTHGVMLIAKEASARSGRSFKGTLNKVSTEGVRADPGMDAVYESVKRKLAREFDERYDKFMDGGVPSPINGGMLHRLFDEVAPVFRQQKEARMPAGRDGANRSF